MDTGYSHIKPPMSGGGAPIISSSSEPVVFPASLYDVASQDAIMTDRIKSVTEDNINANAAASTGVDEMSIGISCSQQSTVSVAAVSQESASDLNIDDDVDMES